MKTTIDFYNRERKKYAQAIHKQRTYSPVMDSRKINWTRATLQNMERNREYIFSERQILESRYRPFCKQYLYVDPYLNERISQMPRLFPTPKHGNLLICVPGVGGHREHSVYMTDYMPDLNFLEAGVQCFPLYYYEKSSARQASLFSDSGEYVRRDGITDFILRQAQSMYGDAAKREDIFYYVYGFLHLPAYRKAFAADLKKSLPRITLVDEPKTFWRISRTGRALAELHLHYEAQARPNGVIVEGEESGDFRVTKLRFAGKGDKSTIIYNDKIRISGIPARAYEYVVNGRSPVEWVIDRYQIKTDKASGITNDPNQWGEEHGNPRYILDLLLSLITMSERTVDLIDSLPDVKFS